MKPNRAVPPDAVLARSERLVFATTRGYGRLRERLAFEAGKVVIPPWPAAVERAFGDLEQHYGLSPLRVRGLERVALHADLVMLARLSQALSRAREAKPLAA